MPKWIAAGTVLACLLAALAWRYLGDEGSPRAVRQDRVVSAHTDPPATRATSSSAAPSAPAATTPTVLPRMPPPSPASSHPSGDRPGDVRARLGELLAAHPRVTLRSLACSGGRCRAELESVDREALGPVLAALEDPDTGFAGDATTLALEGSPDEGPPFRAAFTLTWDE